MTNPYKTHIHSPAHGCILLYENNFSMYDHGSLLPAEEFIRRNTSLSAQKWTPPTFYVSFTAFVGMRCSVYKVYRQWENFSYKFTPNIYGFLWIY